MTFTYAIRNARILQPGCNEFSAPASLFISGDTFVGDAGPVSSRPVVDLDLDGRWVIPGLIDLHAHLTLNPRGHCTPSSLDEFASDTQSLVVMNLTEAVTHGICLIRDVGAHPSVLESLLRLTTASRQDLPEVVSCGSPLCLEGGHGTTFGHVLSLEADFRKLLEYYAALGIRDIKVMNGPELWDEAALRFLVGLANAEGMGVVVHAFTPEGVRMSLLQGVSSIEHALPFDSDQRLHAMSTGVLFVPTLYCSVSSLRPEYALTERSSELRHLQAWRDHLEDCAKREMWRGVPLGIGTDAGCAPCGFAEYGHELASLVRSGVPPSAVLRAATEDAARFLGFGDRVGSIAAGFSANCVVLDDDPLLDVATLLTPAAVFYKGRDILHRFGATALITPSGGS